MAGVVHALVAALALAGVMTFGDFAWERFGIQHKVLNGILHGAAMCLALGLALGVPRGQAARSAAFGLAIGVAAALSFYVLAMAMGYSAMFLSWMALWAGFALLHARALGEPKTTVAQALARGAIAAVGSGLAFYAIAGIWSHPHREGGPDYVRNFGSWTIAFLPGFLALLVRRRSAVTPR
jgi:hypothetical protein